MNRRIIGLGLVLILVLVSGCSLRPESESGSLTTGLYVAGWLARSAGRSTFCNDKYIKLFKEINPVWYTVATNGSGIAGSRNEQVVNWARNYGVKLIPTLKKLERDSDDPNLVTSVLDDTRRAGHIAAIISLVVDNNFDGIDINYESPGLSTVDKGKFVTFIQELGRALQAQNKLLSVCVYDPASGVDWQDWTQMAPYVDSLKVMVYNFDVVSNPVPNPTCPLTSLRDTLEDIEQITASRGKIIIGLPLYGRHWAKGSDGKYTKRVVLYSEIKNEIAGHEILRKFDEPYYTYQDSGGYPHTVYYQDATALAARLKLITQYSSFVKGITFWDLGGEDPHSWKEIAKY